MALIGKHPKKAVPSKAKIIVFGSSGVGKTWTSLDFPATYYIDTEGGANLPHYTDKLEASGALYMGPEDGATDFRIVIDQVRALATEKHDRKTLIIDSITHLYLSAGMAAADAIEKAGKGDGEEFGRNLKEVQRRHLKPLLQWIDRLDMNVILVAHEKNHYKAGEVIGVTADVWEKCIYHFNLVLQVTKAGANRYMTPVKSRIETFPEGKAIPWAYEEFAKRYGEEAIKSEVKSVKVVDEETLKALKIALADAGKPEEWMSKMLDKAGVSKLSDMDQDKAEKLLNTLT